MCGIAGIVNRRDGLAPPELDALGSMAGALRHRGPDEFGMYRDARAGLSHARLSIIDLASGQQPLTNETGTLWIAFNGEIFNYIELRDDLEARGHRFRTRSDTEVIVHAYEEWGAEAFRRFNGQWALALWDAEHAVLVLARDPYGVRPLYVAEHAGRIYFASEVKAIFAAAASLPRRFDAVGLEQLFTFWTPVAPRTIYEGIEEVEPGTVRTYAVRADAVRADAVRANAVRTDTRGSASQPFTAARAYTPGYPSAESAGFSGTLDEAVEAVRASIEQATSLRMLRADVPVGSYLSGGIDSSMVAALGLRATGARFSTFSLRFDDAEYDETPFQRTMAEYLGSDHHEVLVSRRDIAEVFPQAILHTERPVLRTAPAPLYLLSRLVRDAGIKVVLTGEGADEMFAGYDLFREARIRRFWAKQPQSAWRPRLLERLYPYLQRSPVSQRAMAQQFFGQGLESPHRAGFGHDMRWRGTAALRRLFSDDLRARNAGLEVAADLVRGLPPEFARWSPLAQDQFLEVHTLLSGYLLSSQGDRMLMANSVEGRFPFLDRQVGALAESLPASYKLRVLDEKHVLKRAARGLVPQAILDRKKQPYRAPDALSFADPAAAEWIEATSNVQALADAGVFNPRAARQLIDKCRQRAAAGQFSNADNMAVVGILSTQLVHHHFIARRPQAAPPPVIRTVVDRLAVGAGAR